MLIGMRAYLRDFALRPAVQIGFTSSGKETSGCENWLFCSLRVKYPSALLLKSCEHHPSERDWNTFAACKPRCGRHHTAAHSLHARRH